MQNEYAVIIIDSLAYFGQKQDNKIRQAFHEDILEIHKVAQDEDVIYQFLPKGSSNRKLDQISVCVIQFSFLSKSVI